MTILPKIENLIRLNLSESTVQAKENYMQEAKQQSTFLPEFALFLSSRSLYRY